MNFWSVLGTNVLGSALTLMGFWMIVEAIEAYKKSKEIKQIQEAKKKVGY